MAEATTEKFAEMVFEIETAPNTFARICGLKDATINRSASLDTEEVPDCDDETLPYSLKKEVRSINITVTATGVWAQESSHTLLEWFYSSAAKKARLGHLNAKSGETEYEQGPMFLTGYNNARTKGKVVTADLTFEFDGTPERIAKA